MNNDGTVQQTSYDSVDQQFDQYADGTYDSGLCYQWL